MDHTGNSVERQGIPLQKAPLHKEEQNPKHYYSLIKTVISDILTFWQNPRV